MRETTIRVTAPEVRGTRAALRALREREYEYSYSGNLSTRQTLTDRVGDSKEALRVPWTAPHEDRERIRDEHLRRVSELAALRKELKALKQAGATLEATLDDQEASYAQHEMCGFIRRRKYAHSPRNLAHAMAGLPYLGSWQSFRRCGEHSESPIWPTLRFRSSFSGSHHVFDMI